MTGLAQFGGWWVYPDDIEAYAYLQKMGGYETQHLEEALSFVTGRRTAVDVGAHIGTWARPLSEQFGRVLAFEPNPSLYRALVANCSPAVQAYPVAISDAPGRGQITVPNPRNLGTGYLVDGAECVVLPLDWYGLEDVDLLKIDVEGLEPFVIEGARNTIEASWPVIVMEEGVLEERYSGQPFAAGRLLESWGYRRVRRLNKNSVYARA